MLAECAGWRWIGCGGLFMLMGVESKYHSLSEAYCRLDADGRRGMAKLIYPELSPLNVPFSCPT